MMLLSHNATAGVPEFITSTTVWLVQFICYALMCSFVALIAGHAVLWCCNRTAKVFGAGGASERAPDPDFPPATPPANEVES